MVETVMLRSAGSIVLAFHKNHKTLELFQQKFRIEKSRTFPYSELLFTIAVCVQSLNSMSISYFHQYKRPLFNHHKPIEWMLRVNPVSASHLRYYTKSDICTQSFHTCWLQFSLESGMTRFELMWKANYVWLGEYLLCTNKQTVCLNICFDALG